jgi:hypothetical protein
MGACDGCIHLRVVRQRQLAWLAGTCSCYSECVVMMMSLNCGDQVIMHSFVGQPGSRGQLPAFIISESGMPGSRSQGQGLSVAAVGDASRLFHPDLGTFIHCGMHGLGKHALETSIGLSESAAWLAMFPDSMHPSSGARFLIVSLVCWRSALRPSRHHFVVRTCTMYSIDMVCCCWFAVWLCAASAGSRMHGGSIMLQYVLGVCAVVVSMS